MSTAATITWLMGEISKVREIYRLVREEIKRIGEDLSRVRDGSNVLSRDLSNTRDDTRKVKEWMWRDAMNGKGENHVLAKDLKELVEKEKRLEKQLEEEKKKLEEKEAKLEEKEAQLEKQLEEEKRKLADEHADEREANEMLRNQVLSLEIEGEKAVNKQVEKLRESMNTIARSKGQAGFSASSFAKGDWFKITKFSQLELHDRRPYMRSLIPATLMWEGFNLFIQEMISIEPEKRDCEFVLELSEKMSGYFESESKRQEVLRELLKNYYGVGFEASGGGAAAVPDLNYRCSVKYHNGCVKMEGIANAILIELKNEVGSGGGDPFLQDFAYYFLNFDEDIKTTDCRLPCMLLLFAGPHVAVCGAVIGGNIIADYLTPYMPLLMDLRTLEPVARLFRATVMLLKRLREYYETNVFLGKDEDRVFPEKKFCTRYPVDDGIIEWKYEDYLEEEPTKALYRGTAEGLEVVVKFTRHYCPEAHRICESKGYAPKLLGYEDMGAYKVIVMELVGDSQDLHTEILSEEQKEQLKDAISTLHNKGYAHGDLRKANVLLSKDKRIQIIDFDWAGKAGTHKYPLFMNHKDILWPEGATEGETLQREHDLEFLRRDFGIV